jgi:hypothetical protein
MLYAIVSSTSTGTSVRERLEKEKEERRNAKKEEKRLAKINILLPILSNRKLKTCFAFVTSLKAFSTHHLRYQCYCSVPLPIL